MHSSGYSLSQAELLAALEERRLKAGASQTTWAAQLKVSQGHYSKIIRGLVPLSYKARARVTALLETEADTASNFEQRILETCRASQDFRALIHAALKMHKKA